MRKFCIFTSTRAEYGLLRPLARRIARSPDLRLQWIVSGTHLSERFGNTYRQIEADGFHIDEKLDMGLSGDTPCEITHSASRLLAGLGDAFRRLNPDAAIVLGDRYELLAVGVAAMLAGIPIVHIAGGEITEGAMDDSVRHAVSKLSWLHFVSTERSRKRLIQLGEAPERVFHVGAVGLDNVFELDLLDRAALSARLDFDLAGDYLLVTYHPVTLGSQPVEAGIEALLAVLEKRNAKVIFTGVNADPGYAAIDARVRAYAGKHTDRVHFCASLGQLGYLSAMKHCAAVVGNSSSGLVEAPSMGVPTVNIGDRQRGRERAASVVDCAESAEAIDAALQRALSPDFRAMCRGVENPYGKGGANDRIFSVLAKTPLHRFGMKSFYDL